MSEAGKDMDAVFDDNVNYLKLNDISAYKTAFELSNYVWEVVRGWNYFDKDTVGKQLIKAVDSISANIAEGFGTLRSHFQHIEQATKRNLQSNQLYKPKTQILTTTDITTNN